MVICLLLALLFPNPHVQPRLVLEHETFVKMLSVRSAKVSERVSKHFSAKGFSKASIERQENCALLCGRSVEARLQSRVLWLLHLNQSHAQIAEAVATCSPILGDKIEQTLKQAVHLLSDITVPQDQIANAFTCSSVFVISAKQNLQPTVQWLLDLGLRQPQVVKIFVYSPEILGFSVAEKSKAVRFLLDLGLSKNQIANVITRCPEILAGTANLKSTVHWLRDFRLTQSHVVKLIAGSPLNSIDQKMQLAFQ